VKDLAKKRNYTVPVIIVLVAIAASFGIAKYLNRLGREGGIIAALKANEQNAHQTRDAQIANIVLNDGSTVKVGPQSKLVVADKFGDDMRVIALDGMGEVAVSPGHSAPFEVRAFNAVVDAPAGSLVVRTVDADSSVILEAQGATDSLRVGKVTQALVAGTPMHVAHDGQVSPATPDEVSAAMVLVTDTLSMTKKPLSDAVDALKMWYDTKVYVPDSTLLTRSVTMAAPLSSSVAAIAAIEKSANVKFGYEGQNMVFRDAGKAAETAKAKPKTPAKATSKK
jgi:ferric-dicitrate binding protein FerR (iron transport regulator)